ncbi:hypothetical protein [Stenotrophomonas nitritireducens]|uniref:hypothetical protein n=1 Tax=Stenotrophomonas nitritireducens TaxID=83617 RepID=UPI003D955EEC
MPQLVHSVNSPAAIRRDSAAAAVFRFCFTHKPLILNGLIVWLFFDQVEGKASTTALDAWSTTLMHRVIHMLCG